MITKIKEMTQEQYELLKPFEQVFRWAIKSNFIHLSNGEFSTIKNLYHEVTGKSMSVAQSNCNACRLKALQELGKIYFEHQEALQKEEEARAAEEALKKATEKPVEKAKAIKTNKGTTTAKKKAGRPKKIDLEG